MDTVTNSDASFSIEKRVHASFNALIFTQGEVTMQVWA